MNPNGNAEGTGWVDGNAPTDCRNHWHVGAPIPSPMRPRNFRNDRIYGHQPNSIWPGPWMFHCCSGPNQNRSSRLPRPVPHQVFRQHQPFGGGGQQAPAGAHAFPPPAHIPRLFYVGSPRAHGRRLNRRQFARGSSQHSDVSLRNGAASGAHHPDQQARFFNSKSKAGHSGKGRKKHHWKKRTHRGGSPQAGTQRKIFPEAESHEGQCKNESRLSNELSQNGDLHDTPSVCSHKNTAISPEACLRKSTDEGIVSNSSHTLQSVNCATNSLSADMGLGHQDNQLEELGEGGAVGGVGISHCYKEKNTCDPAYCQLDKDLIDEGAICDLDGIFQNQEYFKDNDKSSLCNSDEEQSDSSFCFGERKTSVNLSEDSESENGAYGGLPSVRHTSHSFHNGKVTESPRDKIMQLKCYRSDELTENSQLPSYENDGNWFKDNRRQEGNVYHQVLLNGNNVSDSGGEDNGDFIDTDLPSCNKHILSSSDEMGNMSSDDERDERQAGQSTSPHKFKLDNADVNRNDLSTAPHKLFNEFEHLSLWRETSLTENGFSRNRCHLHNDDQDKSNCDSQSQNKFSCYSKQARYLSENSESDCENCDINHTVDEASKPSQTTCLYPAVLTHSPVIGAAASTQTRGDKALPDHPGADGESFPSAPQTSCFHSDVSSSSFCNLSSSKTGEIQHQPYLDNPALSASSEQWSSLVHNPACGPSFVEGSACCSHEDYPNVINDLSALCHHSNGHSANGFSDGTGPNFINDESNQHQKVFMKKSVDGKQGTEASYSASSFDDKDRVGGSNLLENHSGGESGNRCAEELLTPDSSDSVDMVLLPMEEEIEPVHFMAGLCPSAGSGSGDEDEAGQLSGFHPPLFANNVQAVNSALSCDDCHCTCKDPTLKLSNRLPSKEFYELIKSVSASDSYMRFFDKDGQDVQRSSLKSQTDEDGIEQYNRQTSSKSDRLKVDRVMIWNEYEAYVVQFKQIAVSACGQTAVLNVMKALKFNCDKAAVCQVIKTSLRKEDKDIPEYLFSRACAGTTATELKEGVEKLSGGAVGGRFFHFWPPRKVKLLHWLAYWMKRGAIPMATMNLQQGPHSMWEVPDSWHHQMVYGVSDQGLYLTNPLEIVSERSAMKQLCSDSVLLVRRQDIISRFQDSTDLSQLLDHPDPRWMSMNVLGQVVNVLRECNMPSVPGYRLQVTSHVSIPASYQAGIMLFMRKDKGAWKSLMEAPDLPLEETPLGPTPSG